LYTKPKKAQVFIGDCIERFSLFKTDGENIWNDSLDRRMAMMDEISRKKSGAAKARWDKHGVERVGIGGLAMQEDGVSGAYSMQ
jgi:hypothetical protein